MTKLFNKFKNLFLAHFSNFGGKKFFLESHALTTIYGFLTQSPNIEKANDIIPRKRLDRRKDGERKEGCMGPFQLLPGVQKAVAVLYLRSRKLKKYLCKTSFLVALETCSLQLYFENELLRMYFSRLSFTSAE